MSEFRFCHIDHLRLGAPLEGLDGCPSWLRSAAVGAVRESIRRLFDVVVSQDCQFLLLGGRVAESPEWNAAAIAWLAPQCAALEERGISLAVCGNASERTAWSRVPQAVWFSRNESLYVAPDVSGRLRLATGEIPPSRPHCAIRADRRETTSAGSCVSYVMVPAQRPGSLTQKSSVGGVLVNSAGSPQSVSPAETGVFGCQLVEGNLDRNSLVARFVPLNPVRFESAAVSLAGLESAEEIVAACVDAVQSFCGSTSSTAVVDWELRDWSVPLAADEGISVADELLHMLRHRFRNGHLGLWPRRLRFDSHSCRGLRRTARPAMRALANAITESSGGREPSSGEHARVGDTAERLMVAAEFLSRAA